MQCYATLIILYITIVVKSLMPCLGASSFRLVQYRMGYAIIARRFAVPGSARIVEDLGLATSSTDPACKHVLD
jgi:hypothetical protein